MIKDVELIYLCSGCEFKQKEQTWKCSLSNMIIPNYPNVPAWCKIKNKLVRFKPTFV